MVTAEAGLEASVEAVASPPAPGVPTIGSQDSESSSSSSSEPSPPPSPTLGVPPVLIRPSDLSLVSDPPPLPPPAVVADVPPPVRATLMPLQSPPPCPPAETSPLLAKAIVEPLAVAGAESDDDETMLGDIVNAKVAVEMNKFITEFTKGGKSVGIAAFLIFALKYRKRVRIWYGLQCQDLLDAYIPWAASTITDKALCDAVGCTLADKGELRSIEEGAEKTNHWVAALPSAVPAPSLGEDGPVPGLDGGETEVTRTFHAQYLSFSLTVTATTTDGNCAFDVMCMMLDWDRTEQNRKLLRSELSVFALKHIGNRAFVAMLSKVGEVNMHLGLFELESAGMSLLEDGVQVTLPDCPQPTVGAAKPEFTDDEIQALRWKCRIPKEPVEFVIDMLMRLPQIQL